MNRLNEIISKRKARVAAEKAATPAVALERIAREVRAKSTAHALAGALSAGNDVKIIAEFKRRSPSKGVISDRADPQAVARQYEAGGAAAISVLTEPDFFDGSLDDLGRVRQTAALPILRKDFIVDEFQVYQSAGASADALLLIVAALTDLDLRRLRSLTEDELGMDALVEVHTADEMRRALDCGANIIGVNNRNLATFEVSLETSIELASQARPGSILISESGIETADDIRRLRAAGYRGFLIGETLMRAANPAALIAELSQRTETVASPST
ncbi:MAG TPA: indole-3-glycerol phosphate synthase TrpC [Pyrinomonadaceae bacterium]|nr:indole-3-glycerol phosphate synthase TrpC [Pyrinomonadaceae bacterium]